MYKLLIAVLIVSTTACGQQRSGQQGPPALPTADEIEEMVSDLADGISLDEVQEENILELYNAHFEEVKQKMKSGRPDRKEMESLRTDFEKEVNAILSDEQQELYMDYQKKNCPKGKR
ncbi:MAG: hypothetical protein WBM98_02950 [Maribacter sp.]|uniref:hypothetical protein n=1 Tax=Maribacter sp. TaxID=1897614 RepID=UPI003C77CD94